MLSPFSVQRNSTSSFNTPDKYLFLCDAFPDPFPSVPPIPSPGSKLIAPSSVKPAL